MQTDVLIVGQGISGSLLAWFLYLEGKTFRIMDDNRDDAPSKVAAGIINPVTGRRFVYSWMVDVLMPFADDTYTALSTFLDVPLVYKKDIIDIFPTAQMRDAFVARLTENDTFLHSYPDQNHFNRYFHYEHGCGKISPAYMIHLEVFLREMRRWLGEKGFLVEETFAHAGLQVRPDGITYNGIEAEKIIFCDGNHSVGSPYFEALPFSPTKGEVLYIESEDLTNEHIFKRGLMIAPLFEKNLFWVGSSFQWRHEHPHPTEAFLESTKKGLDEWLKVPYKIVDHKAAVRPSTLERRPFVGLHPLYPSVGILNGMGTKGTSLAPFFAHQLVQHLVHGLPVTPQADVKRFARILSR